jgi:hypothetical protein
MLWRKPSVLCAAVLVVLITSRPVQSGPVSVVNPIANAGARNQDPELRFDPSAHISELLRMASHVASHSHATIGESAPSWKAAPVSIGLHEEIPFNFRAAEGISAAEMATSFKCPPLGGAVSEMNSAFRASSGFAAGSRMAASSTRFTGAAGAASEACSAGATISCGTIGVTETLGGALGKVGAVGAGAAGAAAAAAAKRKKE